MCSNLRTKAPKNTRSNCAYGVWCLDNLMEQALTNSWTPTSGDRGRENLLKSWPNLSLMQVGEEEER